MMMLAVKVDVDVMRSANEERRSYAVKMRCECLRLSLEEQKLAVVSRS